MSLRSDPLDELAIPDSTTVEEHDLVTDGDVIVGGQSTVEFGVRGHNVIAGERVQFGGHIEAEADCRLDMWSDTADNVLVGRDAYLGERVHIAGRLMVSGDLDIGDDVNIEEGFEANGWIVIRNPMPTIVFVFVYLSQLLRIGEEEAAADLVSDLLENEEIDADPLVIPRNGHVSDDSWRVSTPATVGDDCRLHGNFRAQSIAVGERNEVFGSLRARGDVSVGEDTVIHGDVTTRNGTVELADGVEIRGDVSCEDLQFHEGALVDGTMRTSGEMSMVQAGTTKRIAADGEGRFEVSRNRGDSGDESADGPRDGETSDESEADQSRDDEPQDHESSDDEAPEAEDRADESRDEEPSGESTDEESADDESRDEKVADGESADSPSANEDSDDEDSDDEDSDDEDSDDVESDDENSGDVESNADDSNGVDSNDDPSESRTEKSESQTEKIESRIEHDE